MEKIIAIIILTLFLSAGLWFILGGFLELYSQIRRDDRKEILLDRIVDSVADRIIAPVIEFISDLVDKIKWLVVERKTDLYISVHRVLKRIIQKRIIKNKETT